MSSFYFPGLILDGAERFREGLQRFKVVIPDRRGLVPFFGKQGETMKAHRDFQAGEKSKALKAGEGGRK